MRIAAGMRVMLLAVSGGCGPVSWASGPATAVAKPERGSEPADQDQDQDPEAVHGMLLMGEAPAYVSHLPMFRSPHDYQVLLRIEFDRDVFVEYAGDRVRHDDTLYTLVPEAFRLPELDGDREVFQASIVRGHFERGGEPLIEQTQVRVVRVIHFRRLDPDESRPEAFRGIVFGEGDGWFLAHRIAGKPDFDQIVEVRTGRFEEPLSEPVEVTVTDQPADQPLQANTTISVQIDGGPAGELDLGAVVYLEQDELKD